MASKQLLKIVIGLFFVLVLNAACQPEVPPTTEMIKTQTAETTPDIKPSDVPMPSPSPTISQPSSLVICIGKEPSSLYLYGSSSQSTRSVLQAIYDGPFDMRAYQPHAVIMESVPSVENGGISFQSAALGKGDVIVDIHGNLVALGAGDQVLPSGCATPDCAVTWDGTSKLAMDQMVVQFAIQPGVDWSDGLPVSAGDSVFSFQLAADLNTPVSKAIVNRTAIYDAVDAQHVRWVGIPGYFPDDVSSVFWSPLPSHILGSIPPQELLFAPQSARQPIGWGPYIIEKWQDGDHILLKKNQQYFRAGEGLPRFDNLVFRFLDDNAESILPALLSKECDLIDQSTILAGQLEEILALEEDGVLEAHISYGPEWEHLDFGILHSSNDDGYSAYYGDRPLFFADSRTRQAIASCIDRQSIVQDLLHGQSEVPLSYLMPTDPWYQPELTDYPFDIEKGKALLDQVGWKDWDANPETPLQAIGIPEIPDGTFFEVNYHASEAPLRLEVANHIAESLWSCGIKVNVRLLPPEELYAPGPGGVLFGRNFDLAQFSWQSGNVPPCLFYTSNQVPDISNNWLTLNLTGFKSTEFDLACTAATMTRFDQAEKKAELQGEAQKLFSDELPVIPLYFRLQISLSRPDFCQFNIDNTSRSAFQNIEEYNYGSGCLEEN